MPLSLTASVDPGTGSVTLSVSGGTAPYVVTGYPAGDAPSYTVRTTWRAVAGAQVGVDGQVPLNTATAYTVRDAAGGTYTMPGQVTVSSSVPLLSDATDPTRVLPVVVVSQPPDTWEAGSVWWAVLDTNAPYVSVAPLRLRNGDLVLRCDTRAQRAALLIQLLRPGHPLLLRAVCPDAVDDVTFIPTQVSDQLVREDRPSGARHLTISYQVVSTELGPYVTLPGRTYADVLTDADTYAALLPKFPTYADLRSGIPLPATAPAAPTALTTAGVP